MSTARIATRLLHRPIASARVPWQPMALDTVRGRVFDHLITIKEMGRGTGLGLATVHAFVISHFNGRTELDSELGAGTTFPVRFPLHDNGKAQADGA
jgi:nitrogen-specific signal transduction histidine kinase